MVATRLGILTSESALNLARVDTRKERLLEFPLVVIAIIQFIPGL